MTQPHYISPRPPLVTRPTLFTTHHSETTPVATLLDQHPGYPITARNVEPAEGESIELVVDQAGTKVDLKKGDRVITSFAHASRDPSVFHHPEQVDLERPPDLYLTFGFGPHKCLGRDIGTACLLTMLKAVAGLKNLRRMPGDQGRLKLINRPNGISQYMTPNSSEFTPFPTTMRLLFDGLPE